MTTLTINIPDGKQKSIAAAVRSAGGRIVKVEAQKHDSHEADNEDEVTHGEFFGENIRRVIKAFSGKK